MSTTVDEEQRLFTMRRGGVLVAVNLGSGATSVDLGPGAHDLLFTTPTAASVDGTRLVLPPHAGAVVVG